MKAILLKRLMLVAWLAGGLAGCDSLHDIGSLTFPIDVRTTINKEPVSGALVYVVQNTEWINRLNSSLDTFKEHKSDYLINSDVTPLTLNLHAYQYVVIVEWNGKLHKLSKTVVPGTDPVANIDVGIP